MARTIRNWLLAATLFLLAATPIVFTREIHRSFTLPKFCVLIAVAPLILFPLLYLLFFAGGWRRLKSAFFVLLAADFASICVSAAFGTDPKIAFLGRFERMMGVLAFAGIMIAAVALQFAVAGDRRRFMIALSVIALAGIPVAIHGALEYGETHQRIAGTIGNCNYLANYLLYPALASLGLAASAAWQFLSRRPSEKSPSMAAGRAALFAAALALFLFTLYFTQTRGAWVGLALGLVLFLAFAILAFPPERRRVAGLAVALPAVAIAVGFSWMAYGRIHSEARDPGSGLSGSGRTLVWRDTVAFLPKVMWVGTGPENFRVAFMPHKSLELARYLPDSNWESPHNTPLNVLATQGVLGLAVYFGWLGLFFRSIIRAFRRADGAADRLALAGVAAAFAAAAIHNLFNCDVLPTSLHFYAFLALATAAGDVWPVGEKRANDDRAEPRASLLAVSAFAVLAFAVTGVSIWYSWSLYEADRNLLLSMNYSDAAIHAGPPEARSRALALAEKHARAACELIPYEGHYHFYLSKAVEPMTLSADRAERERGLSVAVAETEKAVAFTTDPARMWTYLAVLYERAGDSGRSREAVARAIAFDPYGWPARRFLALQLLREGRIPEALAEAEIAHQVNPAEPAVCQTYEQLKALHREH